MTVLIFGASGQDGFYLKSLCKKKKMQSICVSRSGRYGTRGDVSDHETVAGLIKHYSPTHIFHLAATSTTRHDALFDNHAAIATGTLNILEATKMHCPGAKIFITGSGLQFANKGKPISESHPFEGCSPYAVSRIQSVYSARYYRQLGLKVYVGYLFHHESPLRDIRHVSQIICRAAACISKGSRRQIELGDIYVEKEWTFAGDIVEGIFTLVEQESIFEAVIGSGQPYSIGDWLDCCFESVGLDWHSFVRLKEGFNPEYKRLVSDPSTICSLGWKPIVNINELATKMVTAALN